MPITTSLMGLSAPTLNDPSPGYVTNILAALQTIDAHDHTTGKGAPVPFAALNPTSNLGFGGYLATNLGGVSLATAAAAPSGATTTLCVINGDLYYVSATGVAVRVTAGGVVFGTPGSITGDFSSASAAVTYTNATLTYAFLTGTAAPANGAFASLTATGTVQTGLPTGHIFPSALVTYTSRGIGGMGTNVQPTSDCRLLFTPSTTGNYSLPLPAPTSGTLKAVRIYMNAVGTIASGNILIQNTPIRSSGSSTTLGGGSYAGSKSGDFIMNFTSLTPPASCVAGPNSTFNLYFSSSSSTTIQVFITGVEADWQVAALNSTVQ